MPHRFSPSRSFSLRWSTEAPEGLPLENRSDFRSGREGLFALSRHLRPMGKGSILLPAWVAEGVYLPFQRAGWNIHFYNLDRLADPVWEEVESLLQQHDFDLVILIHFFGLERDTMTFSQLLPPTTRLLEDWAHSYPHPQWPPPRAGQWALFSPTKIIGTTDGAWLIGPTHIAIEQPAASLSWYVFWQLLYLLGSTALRKGWPGRPWWPRLSGGAYARAYELLVRGIEQPSSISNVGRWLIAHTPHSEMVEQRRAQARYYYEHLQENHFRFLLPENYHEHPLIGFPLWVDHPAHFTEYLKKHGIRGQRFTDRWWFIPDEASDRYAQSKALIDHHFLLPINNSFTIEDIAYIVGIANGYGERLSITDR